MMASLLIPPSVTTHVDARFVARRVAMGLWQLNYLGNRSDVERSLSDEGLPSLMVTVPDTAAPHGRRMFRIWVEEEL